jgi:hypothetical protein
MTCHPGVPLHTCRSRVADTRPNLVVNHLDSANHPNSMTSHVITYYGINSDGITYREA